jgi:hypothetical protein
MHHKPKKIKEISSGETMLSFNRVIKIKNSVSVELNINRFYGYHNSKASDFTVLNPDSSNSDEEEKINEGFNNSFTTMKLEAMVY